MTEPTTEGVVRLRRIELEDGHGRVRVALGCLDLEDRQDPTFGIALLDEAGVERAWLSLNRCGPALGFVLRGNLLLSLGINDPGDDALHIGAYLHASDLDGIPVSGWQIEEDGAVLARLGGPTRHAEARAGAAAFGGIAAALTESGGL